MSPIALIDALFFAASGVAFLLVLVKPREALPHRGSRPLLACLIFFTTVYSLCLFVEWSEISGRLDEFEDIIGALLPMWWAFLLYGIVQEITNSDLHKSEQKARAILDQAFQYTGLLSPDGLLISSNKASLDLIGRLERDVINKPFWETPWWEHSEELQETVQKAIGRARQGELVRFDATHIDVRGKTHYVDFSIKAIRDDKGEVLYLIPEGRDITDLKLERQRYKSLFESAGDAIFIMKNDVFQDCNKKTLELFECSPDDILGRSPYDFSPEQQPDGRNSKDLAIEKISKVLAGHPQTFEWKHRKKNGQLFDAEVSLSSIKIDSENLIQAIVRDITKRKLAEEARKDLEKQLLQTQKMESIGALAGGIAHDFNNILSAIFGYAEMVIQELQPGSRAHEMQTQVIKAANRAKDLVQQILLFSRQADQEVKPIQPASIVKEALKLLRATIPTTIEIKTDIPDDCGSILADPTQIHQIIMNLCTNAYHAMREKGGILGVKLSNIEVTGEDISYTSLKLDPGRYLKLEISDTGHGMTPQIIDKIFQPYFTTKKKGEGTGLGLSVVHGIVKSCGGHITVYSEPGKGTVIHVYFPRLDDAAERMEELQPEKLPTGDERILVVEDEKIVLDMMKQTVEGLGYEVVAFTDSREALKSFEDNPLIFDLVITDMTMPHMTGMELSKQIFAIRAEMPIILCTGFSELISAEKAEALGIKKFLTKPVLRVDMAKAIRQVLDESVTGN